MSNEAETNTLAKEKPEEGSVAEVSPAHIARTYDLYKEFFKKAAVMRDGLTALNLSAENLTEFGINISKIIECPFEDTLPIVQRYIAFANSMISKDIAGQAAKDGSYAKASIAQQMSFKAKLFQLIATADTHMENNCRFFDATPFRMLSP